MVGAYHGCYNITGSPVCGEKVTNMCRTYQNCYNLTGAPVCGNNVVNMVNTYWGCRNLTGSPVCGNKVNELSYAYYGCYNLTGAPVCGPNTNGLVSTYQYCYNLAGNAYFYSNNISYAPNCFNGRYNTAALKIYVNNGTNSLNTLLINNSRSLVGKNITWTNNVATNGYYYNAQYNIYIYPVENVHNARIANGE